MKIHCTHSRTRERNILSRKSVPLMLKPYSYLESIPEEKAMIQKLYEIFASTRSIKKTADKMNELGYRTKIGSKHCASYVHLSLLML